MKREPISWIISIILLIAVILLFFGIVPKSCSDKRSQPTHCDKLAIKTVQPKDSLVVVIDLQANCQEGKHPVAKARKVQTSQAPQVPQAPRNTQQTQAKAPVQNYIYVPTVSTEPVAKSVVVQQPLEISNYTVAVNDKYASAYIGSHGVTITEDMRLVYFLSDVEYNAGEGKPTITAPRLNGKNSNKNFYFDKPKNLWIYESNTFITASRLESGNPVYWNAYIGDNEQWGYEMFLPHEIVKVNSNWSAISVGEILQHKSDIGWDYQSIIQFKIK